MIFWLVLYNITWLIIWPFLKLWCKLSNGENWHCRRIIVDTTNLPFKEKTIWLHALSLGEINTAFPLIHEFKKSGWNIIVSSTTKSGLERATQLLRDMNTFVFPMPLDSPWNVKEILENPIQAIVIVETDIWPNLVWLAHKNRIPIFLVNARMRHNSFRKYEIIKRLKFNIFSLFTHIFPASESDKRYYSRLTDHDSKVTFLGSLKWDYVAMKKISSKEIAALRQETNISPKRPIWVAGSIHEGEEEIIIKAHKKVKKTHKNALLIIAPRKLELTKSIIKQCYRYGLKYKLRSERENIDNEIDVFIVNSFGELLKFYGLGHCAFVGGSMVKFGGHNLFEPAIYDIPVCWGPHVFNFLDMAKTLKIKGQGKEIPDYEGLTNFVTNALSNRSKNFLFRKHPYKTAKKITSFITKLLSGSTIRN